MTDEMKLQSLKDRVQAAKEAAARERNLAPESEDAKAFYADLQKRGFVSAFDMLPRCQYDSMPSELQELAEQTMRTMSNLFPSFIEWSGKPYNTDGMADHFTDLLHTAFFVVFEEESTSCGLAPMLYPEELIIAWERIKSQDARKGITDAVIEGRQVTVTDEKYRFALTPHKNKTAYVAMWDSNFMQQLEFNSAGELVLQDANITAQIKTQTANGMKNIEDLDLPLLRQVFTAIFNSYRSYDDYTVSVYLPDFCKSMGIEYKASQDGKPTKGNELFEKLSTFENCMGVMQNGSFYKMLNIVGYDKAANRLVFASPYCIRIIREVIEANTRTKRNGDTYTLPAFNYLIKSTIVKERNKPAAEIVTYLITGLQRRGSVPDALLSKNKSKQFDDDSIVSYDVSIGRLIDDIPLLASRLKSAAIDRDKNIKLRRAFEKVPEILQKQTDAFAYYRDLKITMPANLTVKPGDLAAKIIITHRGIEGTFGK